MSNNPENTNSESSLERTVLYDFHLEHRAKMVPFAGFEMPVSYPTGIAKEHEAARKSAALFDISHMGQAWMRAPSWEELASFLESLTPGSFKPLKAGRQRYTLFTNETGGVIDDLMVSRPRADDQSSSAYVVVNASRKSVDFALMNAKLPPSMTLTLIEDRGLVALQGPMADAVMQSLFPDYAASIDAMPFMGAQEFDFAGGVIMSRSGYSGEDGFEISVKNSEIHAFVEQLQRDERVQLAGLAARDTLRLEASLCLYGNELTETISPIEAALGWAVPKRRREERNFPGADIILSQLEHGPPRVRVGIEMDGRQPIRAHFPVQSLDGDEIGEITSGGVGFAIGKAIGMALVKSEHSAISTPVHVISRGQKLTGKIVDMPFRAAQFKR